MGWDFKIPNPLKIGGGSGGNGRIEIYNSANVLVGFIDDTGFWAQDPTTGSYVRMFGNGTSQILLKPEDQPPLTYDPAAIWSVSLGITGDSWLLITAPAETGVISGGFANLVLQSLAQPDLRAVFNPTCDEFRVVSTGWLSPEVIFNLGGTDMGRGFRHVESQTVSSGAIGAEAVVLTIANHLFRDGRAYRITMEGAVAGSAAGNLAFLRLRKTNAAGQALGDFSRFGPTPAGALGMNVGGTRFISNVSGADITADLVLTLASNVGTCTMIANGQMPRYILSEDCGAATDYVNAVNIV